MSMLSLVSTGTRLAANELNATNRPHAFQGPHDRHGAAEQVDVQLLALGQPIASLAHQIGLRPDDAQHTTTRIARAGGMTGRNEMMTAVNGTAMCWNPAEPATTSHNQPHLRAALHREGYHARSVAGRH